MFYEQQCYKKIDILGKRKYIVNFNTLNCIPAYSKNNNNNNIPERKKEVWNSKPYNWEPHSETIWAIV